MEIVGELQIPLCVLAQEGNLFLQLSGVQCAGVSTAEGKYTSHKQQSKI